MSQVRTRIAPSPTGYPHIGTIWQALLNYAYAKKHNGQFIVRIEDTDRQRLVADAQAKLFTVLDWFGLSPDESPVKGGPYGPYRQSERLDLYHRYSQQLIKEGKAYYCTCSPERLARVRQDQQKKGLPPRYDNCCRDLNLSAQDLKPGTYVIRMKIPANQNIEVEDLLRGKITFRSENIDDQVLIKSDGFPTYHLAVVVDDHSMHISHMVRGEEWLPSAPKQWLLYDYFGWEKPIFIHTPVFRNPDHSKLSKRHGHTAASFYQEKYLKEAILNYLAQLGWSHPQGKEIFNLDEFIRLFDLKDLSVSGPVFDVTKLSYINGLYIRQMSDQKLAEVLSSKFVIPKAWWPKIVPLVKERIKDLSPESLDYWLGYFVKKPTYGKTASEDQQTAFQALQKKAEIKTQLQKSAEVLAQLSDWQISSIQDSLLQLVDSTEGWKRGPFFTALRVAITGRTVSPPLVESMEILGKDESLDRIKTLVTN
jgi:glutamyl-tRNA synthetase